MSDPRQRSDAPGAELVTHPGATEGSAAWVPLSLQRPRRSFPQAVQRFVPGDPRVFACSEAAGIVGTRALSMLSELASEVESSNAPPFYSAHQAFQTARRGAVGPRQERSLR